MGRYYSGDIEGKFWFGIQSSDAADRFGGITYEPNTISYYFDKNNFSLGDLEDLLIKINKTLNIELTLKSDPNSIYNLSSSKNTKELEENLADLQLGLRIYQCLEVQDECTFEAEL